jgi:DNA-binding transcriptional LysR family regulator
MSRPDPQWDYLRTFLEVLRDGSQSGAARRLGVAQPTIGRHIEALEDALGVALFTRSPRGLAPTAEALRIAPHVEAMGSAVQALSRTISSEASAERGVVRVTASQFMACEVLPAMFASFRRLYPNLTIELAVSNRLQDLLRRDADIAVRMARPKQQALKAMKIGVIGIGLYAHRRYAERFGLPESLDELRQHRMIGYDRDDVSLRSVAGEHAELDPEAYCFKTDSDPAQLAALRAGVAIGGCQTAVAERDRELLPVLPKALRFSLEVWLVMHKDLQSLRRVRLLFDHLAAELRDYVRGRSRAVGK